MPRHIINIEDVQPQGVPLAFAPTGDAAERYDPRVARIAPLLGAQKLGYNLTVLPPGKRGYPFHNHRVNEEMFFVLDGEGEVRIGAERHAIRAGDIIACPPGGPESAHQIINTGNADLRYLSISTREYPEVCEYPDSGKYGVMADYGLAADGTPQFFRVIGRQGESVDYWEGE
jgi:uncharacterized cupin superfamily protein